MTNTAVPEKRKIRNFIQYHGKPFTVEDVVSETGCHPKTVRNNIRDFAKEALIKVITHEGRQKIYIKVSDRKRKEILKEQKLNEIRKAQQFVDENITNFYR